MYKCNPLKCTLLKLRKKMTKQYYVFSLRTFHLIDYKTFSLFLTLLGHKKSIYLRLLQRNKLKIQGLLFLVMIIITKQDTVVISLFFSKHFLPDFVSLFQNIFFFKGRFNLSHTQLCVCVCVCVCSAQHKYTHAFTASSDLALLELSVNWAADLSLRQFLCPGIRVISQQTFKISSPFILLLILFISSFRNIPRGELYNRILIQNSKIMKFS